MATLQDVMDPTGRVVPEKPPTTGPSTTLRLNVRGGSRRSRLVAVPVKVSALRWTFCHRARIIYRVG
jgi:hypothetical protein